MSWSSTVLRESCPSHDEPDLPVASTRNLQEEMNLRSHRENSIVHPVLFRWGELNIRDPYRTVAPAFWALSRSIRSKAARSTCRAIPYIP
jgi:hypothetical protein